jgi:hypothetical protein
MQIRHTIDADRRLVVIVLSGPVTGNQFKEFASNLYGSRAELFDYECILDLLEYQGDISYADLDPLQQNYAERPEGEASSRAGFIVTLDPNFHFWAAALDAQFPGRKHYVVASLEEAFSRLEERRPG